MAGKRVRRRTRRRVVPLLAGSLVAGVGAGVGAGEPGRSGAEPEASPSTPSSSRRPHHRRPSPTPSPVRPADQGRAPVRGAVAGPAAQRDHGAGGRRGHDAPTGCSTCPRTSAPPGGGGAARRLGDPFGSTLVAAHIDSKTQGLGPYAELLSVRGRRPDRGAFGAPAPGLPRDVPAADAARGAGRERRDLRGLGPAPADDGDLCGSLRPGPGRVPEPRHRHRAARRPDLGRGRRHDADVGGAPGRPGAPTASRSRTSPPRTGSPGSSGRCSTSPGPRRRRPHPSPYPSPHPPHPPPHRPWRRRRAGPAPRETAAEPRRPPPPAGSGPARDRGARRPRRARRLVVEPA